MGLTRGPRDDPGQTDTDADAARLLVHRAAMIVSSAAMASGEGATAVADAAAGSRASHGRLLEAHVAQLQALFRAISDTELPDPLTAAGGRSPRPYCEPDQDAPVPGILSDIRRVEWTLYGVDTILRSYGERAPLAAHVVRRMRDELAAWVRDARAELP